MVEGDLLSNGLAMIVVKIQIKLLLISIIIALLMPGIVLAQTAKLPLIFEGNLIIDGNDALAGTVIVAEVDGIEAATNAPDGGIAVPGKYMLVVQNEEYTGKMVVFKVNEIIAGEHEYVKSLSPIVEFDLNVQTFVPADDTADNPDAGNSIPEKAIAYFKGLFGSGKRAVTGIAVGAVVLIIAIVITAVIRRRRYYI